MIRTGRLTAVAATAALAAAFVVPASSIGAGQGSLHRAGSATNPSSTHPANTNPSSTHAPSTPGPHATLPAKAHAYGVYCNKESKTHVAGQKGTPFSQCVTAMAKLATGQTSNPAKACAAESKKHVAGQKGTPFSQCVSAAAKLKAATPKP
jgi:hypothetical protein